MTPRYRAAVGAALFVGLVVLAAGPARAQTFVPGEDRDHPRILYSDSLLSLNDRCIVRQGRLNPGFKPVYVNGRPVGFC
jgi:hypothetical protein